MSVNDGQERRRQLARTRMARWRARRDVRGAVGILYVDDCMLVGIARRQLSD